VAPAPARAQADEPPVQTFPQEFRFLKGFWANEHVPAYRAPPAIHTWRMVTTHVTKDENSLATGTMTGLYSSATTWTDFEQWYQVVLHCTTEEALAYHS
jgi:hypothetical protein